MKKKNSFLMFLGTRVGTMQSVIHDGFIYLYDEQLLIAVKDRLPQLFKVLKFLASNELKNKFSYGQIEQILLGVLNGLTLSQILLYADPKFDDDQMWQIRKGFKDGLTLEQVELYRDHRFRWIQMSEIRLGFKQGLSLEEVKTYADPNLHYKEMERRRIAFFMDKFIDKLDKLIDLYSKHYNKNQAEIKKMLEIALEKVVNGFTTDLGYLNNKKKEEIVNKLAEIVKGLINRLTLEEISLYANPRFSLKQMKQIRLGLEDGLSIEQVKLYASPKFSYEQMETIRKALRSLPLDLVKLIAKPELSPDEMRQMITKLGNSKTTEKHSPEV